MAQAHAKIAFAFPAIYTDSSYNYLTTIYMYVPVSLKTEESTTLKKHQYSIVFR